MKQFIETDFYFLLKESITKNVSLLEWKQAYEQLAKAIFGAKVSTEKMLLHSSLCYAKAEFSFFFAKTKQFEKNKLALSYIEKLLHLIDMQIDFVERLLVSQNNNANEPQLEKIHWHGTQIEFVELIYALHEGKCFGKTTLKKVFFLLGNFFDFEVQDYYRQFWDVRNRVTEARAFFLNKLRKKLSEKLARMDA